VGGFGARRGWHGEIWRHVLYWLVVGLTVTWLMDIISLPGRTRVSRPQVRRACKPRLRHRRRHNYEFYYKRTKDKRTNNNRRTQSEGFVGQFRLDTIKHHHGKRCSVIGVPCTLDKHAQACDTVSGWKSLQYFRHPHNLYWPIFAFEILSLTHSPRIAACHGDWPWPTQSTYSIKHNLFDNGWLAKG